MKSDPQKILLGLVGHQLCGKDTVAEYLVEKHGFTHVSSGDSIREYMRAHDLGETIRGNVHRTAIMMRTTMGADILVRMAIERNATADRLVVSGLRAVPEVDAIKEAGGLIITVTAPIEVRYARTQERNRVGDNVSFDEFKAIEEKEAAGTDPNVQNINAVVARADITIDNSGTFDHFHAEIERAVAEIIKMKQN